MLQLVILNMNNSIPKDTINDKTSRYMETVYVILFGTLKETAISEIFNIL